MSERSAAEVLDDHLREASGGSIDADLERNYDPDVVVLCARDVLHGHDGVRTVNRWLQEELPDANFAYRTKRVADDIAFLEWDAMSSKGTVRDGADSYVIRGGRIVAQTIHYTLSPPDRGEK